MPMTDQADAESTSEPLAWCIIACPHCQGQARFQKKRWATLAWRLYTDFKREPIGSGEPSLVTLCPHCRKCYWREEALVIGFASEARQEHYQGLLNCDQVPHVGTPSAAELETAIIEGLPHTSSQAWELHLMAWHRLNDGLRYEPSASTTHPQLDQPIRAYIAKSLLKKMPNRHPLTRLLRVDLLRQTGQFNKAIDGVYTIHKGLKTVKALGEWESKRRNDLYCSIIGMQILLIEYEDRLPRDLLLSEYYRNTYYHPMREAQVPSGPVEELSPVVDRNALLWKRLQTHGWTCHNCGRGGRAGTDFQLREKVYCRHCGWPQ